MAQPEKPIVMPKPRLNLSHFELFLLSVYSIYVSPSATVVASLMNRKWEIKPRLTAKDVTNTYQHLHDTEHDAWVRAKDMNREEKDLLRTMLIECGVKEILWNVDVVRPVGPTAGVRLVSPTAPQFSSRDEV